MPLYWSIASIVTFLLAAFVDDVQARQNVLIGAYSFLIMSELSNIHKTLREKK